MAAIAFDREANVVDGNVERVMARLFAVEASLPAAKPELKRLAGTLVTAERPGDWAQALMDLGATICRPKAPLCDRCPLEDACRARAAGAPAAYPRRSGRAARPRRHGVAYVLTNGDQIALVKRPPSGLLGGMLALPTSDWRSEPWSKAEALEAAPIAAPWRPAGEVDHVFTHFALTLSVWRAEGSGADAQWAPLSKLADLPSVFQKAARVGLT